MVGISLVHADVIKLGNRQVVALPPGISAIVGIPDTSIVAGDQMIGVIGIDPHIVEVAVGTPGNGAETFAAIFAHDQYKVGFVNFIFVFGIDNQVSEIDRPPHHPVAAIPLLPGLSSVIGAK